MSLQSNILTQGSRLAKLFRNNVGLATHGKYKVRYGLCVGSSDLIGFKPVTITEEMVGETVAVFVAIEVKEKKSDKPSNKQKNFLRAVEVSGGIAIVARDLSTALRELENGHGANEEWIDG